MSNRFAFVLCATLVFVPVSAPTQQGGGSADARLRALYSEEWNWRQQELGSADRFPRVDAASQQARLAYWTRALTTLDGIPFAELSPEEKVNAQVFRTAIRALANDARFRTYEAPFNSDTFFWTEFTPRQGLATAGAYRAFLARLRDVPRYFDEQIVNMRAGLARGFSVPRVSVVGRDKTIEPYVKGDTTNPLYAPFTQMPATIPAAEQTAMRDEAATAIRTVVAPAYERLLGFMRTEYLPKARTTLAAVAMPDGEAYYQAMIEKFTTLNLTARQIHEIGLKEVARIQAEMEATKERAGFKGSMPEFFHFLRTDPQFYAKTPRELLAYSAYVSKKADWKLAETIGFLPRRRHGIRPVPAALEAIYTGGRGGLEACLMNTYNLPARPLYTLAALTLHECTPGHSFQAALALEGPERPPFRRGTSFSGYGEGWGLYTEWLGTVMGIYETPYEDFGRLTYEMWRASRLVIDTGIHAFGWTREQAMDYLRTRAALSEHEITTEVERYIAWPGQALAYKLGELQIRRHRREAEEKLGARFDQRQFHDAILAIGSVPLPVLEQRMAQFIADAGGNAPVRQVQFDVLIAGGTVYDGTGEPGVRADVGITGDRITAVAPSLDRTGGSTVIDATGLAVAPGFINMLSWATESLIQDGRSQSDIRQGVTTEIFGEGSSMGPLTEEMRARWKREQGAIKYDITWTTLAQYLQFLEKKGVSPNVASFVGAATIREHVVGLEDRRPTPRELERMQDLVRQQMADGALGVGSSLIYAPGFYATTEELIALARAAGEFQGKYISHMRSEGNRLEEAVAELIRIGREAGVPAEIYHLKAAGERNWKKMDRVLDTIEAARARGVKVTADMYMYTAGATGLDAALPPSALSGGWEALFDRIRTPAERAKIRAAIVTPTDAWENLYLAAGSAERVLLVEFKNEKLRHLTGRTLASVAAERKQQPEDTILDLILEDQSRVGTVYFLMSEANIAKQLTKPWVSIGSDGGSLAPEGVFLASNPHPRAYGNVARLLGKYVREEKAITLTDAVRRLSGLPAENLGLDRRGLLREGYFADVAIFDPAAIADRATFEKPHQYAVGMKHVLVNGQIVLKDGEHTGATPGRALKGPGATRVP